MKDVPCVGDTPWIWPMLGSPTEYTALFFKTFKEAALGMSIKLSRKLWRGAKKRDEAQLITLPKTETRMRLIVFGTH
jgi:hypothetical protein